MNKIIKIINNSSSKMRNVYAIKYKCGSTRCNREHKMNGFARIIIRCKKNECKNNPFRCLECVVVKKSICSDCSEKIECDVHHRFSRNCVNVCCIICGNIFCKTHADFDAQKYRISITNPLYYGNGKIYRCICSEECKNLGFKKKYLSYVNKS